MRSIEFIGAPGAGKSYYKKQLEDYLLKKKLQTYSHSKVFYNYYINQKKISLLKYVKFKIKFFLINFDNFFIRFLNKNYDKLFKFEEEIQQVNKNNNNQLFLKCYFDNLKIKNNLQTLKLKKWLNIETAAICLSKKINNKKKILINSEGALQRLIRLIINKDRHLSINLLKKIKYSKFESDIIVFVNTAPEICKLRADKRFKNRFKKIEIQKFYKKSKFIYDLSNKKKFIINKNKNMSKLFFKIYENIAH